MNAKCLQVKLSLLFALIALGSTQAQQSYPRIHQPLPEVEFTITEINPGKTSSTQLKGKPLLLVFFSKGCIGSFTMLGAINEAYKKHKRNMNLVLIGIDQKDGIKMSYERFRDKQKLKLPVAYDSVIYKQFKIRSVPQVIWVDKEGIVQAVTITMDEHDLELFLQGKTFPFIDNSVEGKKNSIPFKWKEPFLVNGNGGNENDFLYRSILTQWRMGMPDHTISSFDRGREPLENLSTLQLIGRGLSEMYRVAYLGRAIPWDAIDTARYGKYKFNPIVLIKDSVQFAETNNTNRYCYSQSIPPDKQTPQNRMRIMQSDLYNYFGYAVTIEKRKVPYLRLITKGDSKKNLTPDTSKGISTGDIITGGAFNNISVQTLIRIIDYTCQLSIKDLPILDETGITGNIDITLNAVMSDLEDIRKALQQNGLDIVQGEKEMQVLVIREGAKEKQHKHIP